MAFCFITLGLISLLFSGIALLSVVWPIKPMFATRQSAGKALFCGLVAFVICALLWNATLSPAERNKLDSQAAAATAPTRATGNKIAEQKPEAEKSARDKAAQDPAQIAPESKPQAQVQHLPKNQTVVDQLVVGLLEIKTGALADDVLPLLHPYQEDMQHFPDPNMPGSMVIYYWYKIEGQWYRLEFQRIHENSPYEITEISQGAS